MRRAGPLETTNSRSDGTLWNVGWTRDTVGSTEHYIPSAQSGEDMEEWEKARIRLYGLASCQLHAVSKVIIAGRSIVAKHRRQALSPSIGT